MTTRARMLIVDDHPVFRQGLRQMIERDTSYELVGEAGEGETALALLQRLAVEIVVLDLELPGLGGLQIIQRLHERRLAVKVIILTMHKGENFFNEAMNLDVRGYLIKDNALTEIMSCLRAVAAGEYYLTPSISAYLLRRRHRGVRLAQMQPGVERLTTAERRILKLIGSNKTSKQIAKEIVISPRTVEAHRSSMCSKLSLHGSNCLLQFAIEHRSEL